MAKNNLFLQSPTAGDIQEIFTSGSEALAPAPVHASVAAQGLPQPVQQSAPVSTAPRAPVQSAPVQRRASPSVADLERRAAELDIDPALARSFFTQESSGNWNSRDSGKGAVGGMQVMPGTYKAMMGSYSGQRDPWSNMEAGLRYIAYGQKTLNTKDPALLAAGYHAGYDRKDLKAGKIPQNIGDGHIRTADYAASVAGRLGLAGGKQPDANRYKPLSMEEAQKLEGQQLQATLNAQEPGRYRALTDDEMSKLPASASVPLGVDDGEAKKEVGFWDRLPQVAKNGWDNMSGAVDVSRAVLSDDFTPATITTISTNLENQIRRSVADAGRQHGSERELKAAIEEFGKTEGWGDSTKGLFSLLGTAVSNPKGVAIGTVEQIANMLPSIGGAASGAAAGAGVGAAVGSIVPGAGTAAGAASGALWGSRAGLMAGTAALEFGNEITEAITSRLAAKKQTPTRDNIAALLSDPAVQAEVKAQAAKKGLTLAAVDALSMGLAGKVGSKGVEAAKAGAKAKAAGYGAGAVGVELLGEPAGEAASQLVARGEINKADVAAEGIYGAGSAVGGAAMGTAGQAVRDRFAGQPAQGAAPAAPRQEPSMDVTYTDAQGNTVTEVVPGGAATPAATGEMTPAAAPAEATPSGPIGRVLQKAAPAEAEAIDLPRVRVVGEDGQAVVTGFAEQMNPDGTGRVLGDDGQVHQITAADGLAIVPEQTEAAPAEQAAAPIQEAQGQVQESASNPTPEQDTQAQAAIETEAKGPLPEPDAAPAPQPEPAQAVDAIENKAVEARQELSSTANKPEAQDASAPAATETVAQTATAEAPRAPAKPDRQLTEFSDTELTERMDYIAQQAKINGGMTAPLIKEKGRVQREVNRRKKDVQRDDQPNANGVPDANVAPAGDQAVAPVQGDQPARSAPAQVADVRADAGQEGARATELPVRATGAGADAAAQPDAALKDPHAGRWFGSEEKANAYVAKQGAQATHEVVKTGKVRFEVKPKEKAPSRSVASKRTGIEYRDTRGTGQRFHGTSAPLPDGGPTNDGVYAGSAQNIYGQGFYTTDAADIADGYTKKGKGGDPVAYDIQERGDVRLYDMEQPMDDSARRIAREALGDLYSESNNETGEPITTLAQAFDEARAQSRYEGYSTDEVQERFYVVRYQLENDGYRGLKHVGGKKTGNDAHDVRIYWYPENDISVTRSDLAKHRADAAPPSENQPPAAGKSESPTTDADLDAMFDDAVAAKKKADVQAAAPVAPAVAQPKAVSKSKQAKERVAKVSSRYLSDAQVGDTITMSKDWEYATGGREYTLESIAPNGEITVRSERGGTSFSAIVASRGGVAFQVTKRAEPAGKKKPAKTNTAQAAESLTSAAKNTAEGLTAAIDGLGALFGGSGKFNSGLTFDEETYAKAKPLFKQAVANLGDAGRDLKTAMQAIVNMVMDKFGEDATQRMKPYVVQYVKDVRDGKESEQNQAQAQDAQAQAAIEEVAPADGKARVKALRAQVPAPKKGQPGIVMEPAVAPGGADAIRFHVVDAKGEKIGKTQLVRAATPDTELVPLMQRLLDDTVGQSARFNKPKPAASDVVRTQGDSNAASTGDSVERRGSQPAAEPVLAGSDGDTSGAVRRSGGDGGRASGEANAGQQSDPGVSADRAPANGDASLVGVHRGDGAAEFAAVAAGSDFRERGSDVSDTGVSPDARATEAARAIADSPAKQRERQREQRAAAGVKNAPGIENVRATLPALLPGQQEDVVKVEARFAKPDGYGMLLTNGTGTGKTYSGLGVAKRYAREGKGNILVVVPDDKVASDWVASAGDLDLTATQLADTKRAGTGMVVTTYAGLGQNNALASRKWDLVIADESHKLMQGADGRATAALDNLRAITMHPDGAYTRYQMQNAGDIATLQNLMAQQQDAKDAGQVDDAIAAKIDALDAKLQAARKAVQADVEAGQGAARPRALFLSATPFAYEKTTDWANGYLFEYQKAEGTGYNSGNGQQQFMMQHFGYTMRYNKLTEPDSKVDRGLMQRNFNTWLKREGALSGRTLDVEADYDRRFVLIDSKVGNRIDDAFSWLDNQRKEATGEDARVWQAMGQGLHDAFDYLSRRYLLEAMKAKESIPYVRKQMEMGRKVVVFHDYKQGGGFNPFATYANIEAPAQLSQSERAAFTQHMGQFRKEFADLVQADWAELGSATSSYREAFGKDVLVVNGDEKARDNLARYKQFQDDATGPQVILVQSAKNAGWSGHDTTGKNQRVLLNLGLPTAPTMAIQQEGRIYRTGQASDAIMRYMNTGTSWEKQAFSSTIAGRASTAENLGMGEDARALKDSFIAAFEESDIYEPGHEGEGKGGKERDRAANAALTDYDRAKAYYWATQKKNTKTKAQEGKDYFATPEPLGQKMVEWTNARGGDKVLEPSAGHGAIARWFGENVERTVVEPSSALRARLSLVIDPANDRVVAANFEDLAITNKYDAIAMNPPFGHGGKLAVEHLAKAAQHLREHGRVVAIIPTGPAADKQFNNWLYAQNDKGQSEHANLHLVADIKLPQSAFERAGTSVAARVVVIDKASEGAPASTRNIDLSGTKDINEFFARLEGIELPSRQVPEQAAAAPAETQADAPSKHATTTQKQDGDVEATHVTGKGKTLRGIVRKGITKEQAKELDAYTFQKDGGWFIRNRHLEDAPRYSLAPSIDRDDTVPVASAPAFDVPPEQLFDTAANWMRDNLQGTSVHSQSLRADVHFSRASRKAISVGRRDTVRMSAVQAMTDMVRNGVLVEDAADRKGRDGVDGYATLVAPVSIDGTTYAARLKVRRAGGRNVFYTVEGFDLEGARTGGVGPLTPTGDAHSSSTLAFDGDATAVNKPSAAMAPSNTKTTVGQLLDAINGGRRAFSTASLTNQEILKSSLQDGNAIPADSLRKSLDKGVLGEVVSRLMANGTVILHRTASSLPGKDAPVGVQAVTTSDGKIHLVGQNLTPATAQGVLLHEAFHAGGEKLLGTKAWEGLMGRLSAIHRQAQQSSGRARQFYDQAAESVARGQRAGVIGDSLTAEEFGAYTIEHYDQAPAAFRKWVDDLVGAVKAWLLQRFGKQLGEVTPAQLHALAVAALKDIGAQEASLPRYSLSAEEKADALDAAATALKTQEPERGNERIGRMFKDMDGFVGLYQKWLVHPRTIAALYKKFVPVYLTGISQTETRDKHIAELGRDVEAYNKLSVEGKASVNKLLELGRLTAQNFTAEQLADGVVNTGFKKTVRIGKSGKPQVVKQPIHANLTEAGEVVQLSNAEAKAYNDLRKMFDAALDKFRDQTLVESGFPELAGQADALKTIEAQAKQATGSEKERLQNIAGFIRDIEQAKRTGYVPFQRYGDFYVSVKEKVADFQFTKDGDDAYTVAGVPPDLENDMLDLGALPEGDAWTVPAKNREAVAKLAYRTVYNTKVETELTDLRALNRAKKNGGKIEEIPSVKAAIDKARAEWVDGHPGRTLDAFPVRDLQTQKQVSLTDVDVMAATAGVDVATWDAVRDKLSTAIQSRSFRKHFFHSDNVPGYSADFERSIADYVIGVSGYMSRRAHAPRWDEAINSIKDEGKLRAYASEYREYVNDPQEEFAFIRQLGFFNYIAGVTASAFANTTQVPVFTASTLSQVAPPQLVARELAKAGADVALMVSAKNGLDIFDPKKAPADVRAEVLEAWDEGAFVPLESLDMMMTARQRNVGRRKAVKGFNDATKIIAIGFTAAERLNRLVTFIAAARLAKKEGVRKNIAERMGKDKLASATIMGENFSPKAFAEWAVDESQFRMGKANRPKAMRGVGAPIMQFKGFLLQALEAMYRMAALHGKEGKMASLATVGAMFAIAGMWGVPGADDLRKVLEAAYKGVTDKDLDLKTEVRGWIARVSGSNVLAQAVSKGASYPLGVDLTRVGMGNIYQDSVLPVDMVIGRSQRALGKAASGDAVGAVSELAPNFIKHPLQAAAWATDGMRNKSGQRIMTPDQFSGWDIAMKGLGFRPAIVSDVQDYEYAQRRQETSSDALKRKYAAGVARSMVAIERAQKAGDAKEVLKLQEEQVELWADIAEHNATAPQDQQINITRGSIKQRYLRESGGVMATWGKERKQARGAAGELRGLYGLSEERGNEDQE